MEKALKFYLLFGSIYMLGEAIVHFSGIRLISTVEIWSQTAFVYADMVTKLYGFLALFAAIVIFELRKDLNKYRKLLILSASYAFFHALLLFYFSFTIPYNVLFANLPSVYLWIPMFSRYLNGESLLLLAYPILVFLWLKRSKKS